MSAFFNNLFSSAFGENVILATILISMIPVVELRGAIPFATNPNFWQHALNNWAAFGYSFLGSSLLVPILALIFMPLIKWLKSTKWFRKLAFAIENRIKNKADSISKNTENAESIYWKKFFAILIFVAIPLPFTGVWTGTCVAVFIGLDFWSTCTSVIAGNFLAGLIITLILEFFPWLNAYLFYIFLGLIVLILMIELVKFFVKKSSANREKL